MTDTLHQESSTTRTVTEIRSYERLLVGILAGTVHLDARDWRYRNTVNGTDMDEVMFDAEGRGWVHLRPGQPPQVSGEGRRWLADRYARFGPGPTRPVAYAPDPDAAARAQKTGAYRGERIHTARLTEQQVRDIKRRRAAGELGTALAAEYGVNPHTISAIHKGTTWRHVA